MPARKKMRGAAVRPRLFSFQRADKRVPHPPSLKLRRTRRSLGGGGRHPLSRAPPFDRPRASRREPHESPSGDESHEAAPRPSPVIDFALPVLMLHHARSPRLGVLLGFVLVAIAFTWPLPLHMSTAFTGDPGGDTGVYVWNQWVFQQEAVVDRHNPLATEKILSLTQRVDLSQHNYTAFLNILALPMIPWLGVVTTFNIVFLLMTVLTAVTTYALARRVTAATRAEAWLAGVLFAWSPVLVARSTGHFSLVAAAPLPAFLFCLINADRTRKLSHAALAGVCMAWAAFCDVYYAVYCLMMAGGFLAFRAVRIRRTERRAAASTRWALDLLILCVGGLVVGLLLGRSGRFELFGMTVSIRGLYTPVLVLTLLVLARILLALRPHVAVPKWSVSPYLAKALIVGVLACAGPLSPVLYGLGTRLAEGRFVSPEIFWRSSPRGVDLLAFIAANPNHAIVRWFDDHQSSNPTAFVEYTVALSLVALLVIVIAWWRAAYRPHAGWIWLTAGFAALALGPFIYVFGVNTHVPGPWALLRYVPIIGAARMPTRFSVIVALGLAVLFAGALAALGRAYPKRRSLITAMVGAALLIELVPVPRTLYSARVPAIYHTIAADPRPVRIIELPFGVRDGVSALGNASTRYQYYQTLHGKQLIGGYLSRISKKRVEALRAQPTLDALLRLSEGQTLTADHAATIKARGPNFIRRANVGYVVINHVRAPGTLIDFVIDAWGLEEVEREWPKVLYRPTVGLAP